MIGAENVQFRETPHKQGDPGKLAYLHNPNWTGKVRVGAGAALRVDERMCAGCSFGTPAGGKWPHTFDHRCKLAGGEK